MTSDPTATYVYYNDGSLKTIDLEKQKDNMRKTLETIRQIKIPA